MLKKFAIWFVYFGLSFLIESFGWAEQGKAFLFLHLGVGLFLIAILAIVAMVCSLADGSIGDAFLSIFGGALIGAIICAIPLFITWAATKLFNVDFYVAYQIISFGQCLISSKEKEDR